MKNLFYSLTFLLFLSSCQTSAPFGQDGGRTYTSLTEYFQNINGIRVTGNDNNGHITFFGMGTSTTQSSDSSPLFVVEGQQVGRSLSQLASILNPNDIKRVKVLRTPEQTSFYGINGANGVIEITIKKE